ncbi:MAG: hypothetical protein R3E94_06730 [Burkholderiaceae bacterium]
MNSNAGKAVKQGVARRAAIRLTLASVLAVGLAACGGGDVGVDSSDDSKDLRAALDRLQAGMTYDEVVAAVGWEPNSGRDNWSHDGLLLQVSFRIPNYGEEPLIETAVVSGRGIEVDRYFQ